MRLSKVVLCIFGSMFLQSMCLAESIVGIGVALQAKGDQMAIQALVDGGVAKEAGILPQDIILEIDGKPIKNQTVEQVKKQIVGAENTEVAIKVKRKDAILDFKMTRRKLELVCDSTCKEKRYASSVCGSAWATDTVESVSKIITIEEIGHMRSDLWNCSAQRSKEYQAEGNSAKALALECYVKTGQALSRISSKPNSILEVDSDLKAKSCSPSGDASLDHLYPLIIASVSKLAADRKPIADLEKKQAAEEAKVADDENKKVQARLNTKECRTAKSARNFCKLSAVARTLELKINHEKKVGEQSGFVNAALLRNTTSTKISVEEEAAKEKSNYKQLTGSGISVSDCQLLDDYPRESRLPKSYLENEKKACGSVEDG